MPSRAACAPQVAAVRDGQPAPRGSSRAARCLPRRRLLSTVRRSCAARRRRRVGGAARGGRADCPRSLRAPARAGPLGSSSVASKIECQASTGGVVECTQHDDRGRRPARLDHRGPAVTQLGPGQRQHQHRAAAPTLRCARPSRGVPARPNARRRRSARPARSWASASNSRRTAQKSCSADPGADSDEQGGDGRGDSVGVVAQVRASRPDRIPDTVLVGAARRGRATCRAASTIGPNELRARRRASSLENRCAAPRDESPPLPRACSFRAPATRRP